MNEELLNELSEAMKRRDKASAAIARWTEQKEDAEEDIRELSARITAAVDQDEEPVTYGDPAEDADDVPQTETYTSANASHVWTPEQV